MGTDKKTLPGLRRPGNGQRRTKDRKGEGHCFHVMSRLTGDVPMWDALEKEALVKLLWKMSAFCGVEMLTYCVMGNHFHALVRVPDRERWLREKLGAADAAEAVGAAIPAAPVDAASADATAAQEAPEAREKREETFYAHLRNLYTKDYVQCLRKGVEDLRAKGRMEDAERATDAWKESAAMCRSWLFTAGVAVQGDDGKVVRRGMSGEEAEGGGATAAGGGRRDVYAAGLIGRRVRGRRNYLIIGL